MSKGEKLICYTLTTALAATPAFELSKAHAQQSNQPQAQELVVDTSILVNCNNPKSRLKQNTVKGKLFDNTSLRIFNSKSPQDSLILSFKDAFVRVSKSKDGNTSPSVILMPSQAKEQLSELPLRADIYSSEIEQTIGDTSVKINLLEPDPAEPNKRVVEMNVTCVSRSIKDIIAPHIRRWLDKN
jgi:hypothetical protein